MMQKLFRVVFLALTGMVLAFGPAEADVTVNCNDGESIGNALSSGETNITVTGTCTEEVRVTSDDVTIVGDGTGEIDGALTVYGAQRFEIRNMLVTASADDIEGIWVTHGASVSIQNVTVSGEPDYCAILVFFDSFADIWNSTLEDNACGLSVGVGSLVSGRNNVIRNNGNPAVEVYDHGTYRARGDRFDGSAGNGPTVILNRNSFLDLRPAYVTGDIAASHQSHLSIRKESTVDGNISINILSELDLRQDSTVVGNIKARNLSIVRITGGATVDGSVSCIGTSKCLPRPHQ